MKGDYLILARHRQHKKGDLSAALLFMDARVIPDLVGDRRARA
jgi:hypothetical protein